MHTEPKNRKLIIARHHESVWNKKGLWTGTRDLCLTEHGREKSKEMGLLIKDIKIGKAFASTQIRSFETLELMLKSMDQLSVSVECSCMHNERDYGAYTGKNKWEMEKLLGTDVFDNIRREWDCPVPNGETLKMVYDRTVPYYLETILPMIESLQNVLLVSHGNAIRSLMKYIEKIPDAEVKNIEMLFGSVVIYTVDHEGYMVTKEERKLDVDEGRDGHFA